MPKPLFGDNGSGMHCHQSLWKGDNPVLRRQRLRLLIRDRRGYIGGLLTHAPAILAFVRADDQQLPRLVPGFEAPVNLVYSARNRSAVCRIPMYSTTQGQAHRVPRPGPACNPYLAFAAMLMAGLDGDPEQDRAAGADRQEPLRALDAGRGVASSTVPASLAEALDALERDHEYLLKGDVFTQDVIDTWMGLKRKDVAAVNLRPHPYEFFMYYDA